MLLPIEIAMMNKSANRGRSAGADNKTPKTIRSLVGCEGGCTCGGGCGAQPTPVAELHHHHEEEGDGEVYMSIQSLKSLHLKSGELLRILNEESELPDWVESKLSRASNDLNDVHGYLTLKG